MNDTYIEYEKQKGKPGYDEWNDFGVDLLYLYQFCRSLPGARIVQILGYEGTGKSAGARTLDPNTTLYLNVDRKPLTFDEEGLMYPNDRPQGVNNSLLNYKEVLPEKDPAAPHKSPSIWLPIRRAIQYAYDHRAHDKFVIFMLGHVEVYEGKNGIKMERLKTLGKKATKLNIEGSLSYCFYTKVDPFAPTRTDRYKLTMHSDYNTARVPMGIFDDVDEIPNDYQLILSKIQK